MQETKVSYQSIRQQLLDQGYKLIVKLNGSESTSNCFLTKREVLPDICSPLKFLTIPLQEDYALMLLMDHFETRYNIIKSLPTIEILESNHFIIDKGYLFDFTEYRELQIYYKSELIDCIDFSEDIDLHDSINEMLLEVLPKKDYFTISLGYALMLFLQYKFPFQEYDFKKILYKYEAREACFEQACIQSGRKYFPNLTLQEKYKYVEDYSCDHNRTCKYSIKCKDYSMYKADVNLYFKLVHLGFILSDSFGDALEPIKIDLSI